MLEEDYCSYEVAKLLKEKGFDYKGFDYIDFEGEVIRQDRPTLQMAMKWLREVHNYHTEIERNFEYFYNGVMHKPSYDAVVQDITNKDKNYFVAECNTYEEAVEAALKYSLENLI